MTEPTPPSVPAPPGRSRESATILERVRDPGPSLIVVTGRRGTGKSTLLRTVLDDDAFDLLWYEAPPLPDPDQRGLLARRLRVLLSDEDEVDLDDDWPGLFRALAEHLYERRRKTVLVLDGWDRLVEARGRIRDDLEDLWRRVRERGLPLHLVLTARPGEAARDLRDPDAPFLAWIDEDLHLGPLPYRAVTALAGDARPARDRLLLHAVFGGWPEVVRHLDPSAEAGSSLKERVTRLVLAPDAPLLRWGTGMLERELQSTGRYASLLRGLADGARAWGSLADAAPDFESGSQMAPYIKRLEALELVAVERSLDAGPRSRRRRYRLTDPFTGFWFGFVLPNLTDLQLGRADDVWEERIRPSLEGHAARRFPDVCRAFVRDHGDEALPARAREVGGLWGRGYELEVSGTLTNGAVFYGSAAWGLGSDEVERGREVDAQLRKTRYGFGREARHRVVFADAAPGPELARWAGRDALAHVISPEDLVGETHQKKAPPGGKAGRRETASFD